MTINRGLPPEASPEALLGGGMTDATSGVPPSAASLPDVEYLTHLANAMFAQPPGGGLGAVGLLPASPATALPKGPLPADPLKPVDVPLAGAPGVNSTFAPSAHGAPLSRPLPPSPTAVPLPGEADLRALLKTEDPVARFRPPRPRACGEA